MSKDSMVNFLELKKYIDEELFEKMYVLHPYYAIHGKIEQEKMSELMRTGQEVVLVADRNVISEIMGAVKRGKFSGENRKKLTAFLIWVEICGFGITPFSGIKECAQQKKDNLCANKELQLFNYLYDNIPMETIIKSFYNENIIFQGKKFNETEEKEQFDFLKEEASFIFLYAAILHLVYVLNKYNKPDEQFEYFFKWYFNECLVSEYVIAYVILFLSSTGIQSPHHYKDVDVERVIKGCANQARDLQYIQDIDPNRYPNDKYVFMCVTNENDIKRVFELVNDRTQYNDINSYLKWLCSSFPKSKRDEKYKCLSLLWKTRTAIKVNLDNSLIMARKLALEEENRLKALYERIPIIK